MQNAVDEATLEIIPKLNIRTGYLAAIGNIATLTGLMGTIFGLILSFEAAGQAGGGAAELSAGIGDISSGKKSINSSAGNISEVPVIKRRNEIYTKEIT